MTAEIISGTQVAADIRAELKETVAKLKADKGVVPGLVIVRVGEDPASVSYVKGKEKACDEVGTVVAIHIGSGGDPRKDVDGFHPVNVGKLLIGNPYFMPCTPHGIQQLLVRSGNDPAGKHVVICGRSNIVGKPILAILLQKKDGANATVTMVHTGTKDTASITRQADILIAAVGRPKVITADMVKEGVVVIDVGVNRVPDDSKKSGFRLVGDTDFEAIKEKAKAITPVPGGVGPMTITMLMWNTANAAITAAG